jgi:hypothetical protein
VTGERSGWFLKVSCQRGSEFGRTAGKTFSRRFNDLRAEFRESCMLVIWTIMGCSQLSLVSICCKLIMEAKRNSVSTMRHWKNILWFRPSTGVGHITGTLDSMLKQVEAWTPLQSKWESEFWSFFEFVLCQPRLQIFLLLPDRLFDFLPPSFVRALG